MKFIQIIFLLIGKCNEKLSRWMDFFHLRYAKAYLSYKKAEYHDDICFYGKPKLNLGKESKVRIGKKFICRSGRSTKLDNGAYSSFQVLDGGTLTIGDYSGMTNTIIVCKQCITIGHHVNIGNGTIIMDNDLHSTDWETRSDRSADTMHCISKPVIIEDHVFVGARSIILKGVTIGEKSIVAAGSVVTHNIPSGEIWGGNPARFIKKIENG